MAKRWAQALYIGLLLVATAPAAADNLFVPSDDAQIIVHNRILATVNGKPISVIDVMKKLDMLFYRQFPQYAESTRMRYQFYQLNWKQVLQDLVDKELIVADAQENKITISNGDVRQEMESMLGPNVIASLDQAGLTLEEAKKMVQEDLLIRRMMLIRVNMKALHQVSPQLVQKAYEEYSKTNVVDGSWVYTTVTIRHPDSAGAQTAAHTIHEALATGTLRWDDLADPTKHPALAEGATLTLSEEYHLNDKEISSAHKEVLVSLQPGNFSVPAAQRSRSDKSTVYRIFYLKEHQEGGVATYSEVENELKEKVLQAAIAQESDKYLKKMRDHYGFSEHQIKEILPSNFEPFSLQ